MPRRGRTNSYSIRCSRRRVTRSRPSPRDTTDTPSQASPTQFVGRNSQWKHHQPEGNGPPPVPPATNRLLLAKLVDGQSAITLPATGPTVTYSLTFSNLGTRNATLDSIRDTLPVGAVYQSGSPARQRSTA
ncbi:MAG: hypothetical protein ACKOCN_08500 [Planctomycetaceae bacterium]